MLRWKLPTSTAITPRFSLCSMIEIIREAPINAEELRKDMEDAAAPSRGYYLMLTLATCLATFGLIADSTAVIIGAMIVAPLMNPIMATSYAIARGSLNLGKTAAFTLLTGILLVIAISAGVTWLTGQQLTGREVMSRGNPSLVDLGIAIASGIAGAFAWSRKKISNALPGVAISVALVPPLCVVGLGLTLGETAIVDPDHSRLDEVQSIEIGAFLLFLINMAAILFFGSVVFLLQGYGRWRGAKYGVTGSMLFMALLAIPLTLTFGEIRFRNRVIESIRQLAITHPHWQQVDLDLFRIEGTKENRIIRLDLTAPDGVFETEDVIAIERHLSARFKMPIQVKVHLSKYETIYVPR